MSKHYANANWEGNLREGRGKYRLNTSGLEGSYRFSSRFEEDKTASSPEELIGAALASCYSMALAADLSKSGAKPENIETSAEVTLTNTGDGFSISEILLKTRGRVDGIDSRKFMEIAEKTKSGCPVSRALKGTNIKLQAELVNVKESQIK
jgi:osmotically inducible protein OsmC